MSAFPPHRTLTSLPVTQEIALKFLTTYLSAAKTTPYLLPNARLESSGITTGSSSSVTVHNLERVQAGLRREWLAPVLELDENQAPAEDALEAGVVEGVEGGDKMEVEGWQDLDEYQREQSIEDGAVGTPRQSGMLLEGDSEFEGPVNAEVEVEEDEAPKAKKVKTKHGDAENGLTSSGPLDKEARKKAKKERLKLEKKKRKGFALKGGEE